MASTYTGLIEELRRAAAHDKAEIERIGIACDCDLAEAAADAIETLINGINAYSDEAFKRAQENERQRRRITELEGLLADQEIEAQEQAAEAAAMYADKAAPAPVWIASRKSILEDAEKCVCGHREEDYGSPEDSFATIADLWTAYSGHLFTPVDVAMMMSLLKIARIAGGRGSEDSFVDLAGYAACGGEIWSKREAVSRRDDCDRATEGVFLAV